MRVFSCLVLILILIESTFAQEIFVKQVFGNVEFVVDEKRTAVKNFSTFSKKGGVFILKDKNSELFIRIGDKLDLLTFSEDKHRFPLIDLIVPKQDPVKKEEGFLDKFFSLYSFSYNDNAKINGMIIADKSGVSRSFNDTNIIFIKEIMMIDGYPLKIDFGSSIDSDKIENNEFNILVKEKYTGRTIKQQTIPETYFTIKTKSMKRSFYTNWSIEINIHSSKKIKGIVKSISLNSAKRKLFDQLRDKAIAESKMEDECTYQIIFLESLRSSGLLANASYYLDLFIETNKNPRLINYKYRYTN